MPFRTSHKLWGQTTWSQCGIFSFSPEYVNTCKIAPTHIRGHGIIVERLLQSQKVVCGPTESTRDLDDIHQSVPKHQADSEKKLTKYYSCRYVGVVHSELLFPLIDMRHTQGPSRCLVFEREALCSTVSSEVGKSASYLQAVLDRRPCRPIQTHS